MDRRSFLERVVQFFSLSIAALFSVPLIRFVASSISKETAAGFYPVARIQELQERITRVRFTRLIRDGWMIRTAEEYVWIRKHPDGSIVVFEPHCTHLGCAYSWDEKSSQFHCPCHGGKFNQNGDRVSGPPPRPLDRYEVKVEKDQVKIGKILKA